MSIITGQQQSLLSTDTLVGKPQKERANQFKAGKKLMARYLLAELSKHLYDLEVEEEIDSARRTDRDARLRAEGGLEMLERITSWLEFNFPKNYRETTAENLDDMKAAIRSRGVNWNFNNKGVE